MVIGGYHKTTLLDYPGHVAATIFIAGCNFRCPFCHNAKTLLYADPNKVVSEEEVLNFLISRRSLLTAVCISGGEPTLQEDLADFIFKIKEMGYLVKLDTNGYRPDVLKDLLDKKLLNYIAMDIKSGFSRYNRSSGVSNINIGLIEESIHLVENSGLPYEFRTTVVDRLHSLSDFYEIREMLSPKSTFYIQSFVDNGNILTPGLKSPDRETLEDYLEIIREKLPNSFLRGI